MLLLACAAGESAAIGRIVLEIGEVSMPGVQASGLEASLDLASPSRALRVRAERLDLGSEVGVYRDIEAMCTRLLVRESELACLDGTIQADGSPLGRMAARLAGEHDMARGRTAFQLSGLSIAGGQASLAGTAESDRWSLQADANALSAPELRRLIAPWVQVPSSYTFDGRVRAQARARSGKGGTATLDLKLLIANLDLTDDEGTVATEGLTVSIEITAHRASDAFTFDVGLAGTAGQALAGPVLLDLGANPLKLQASAALRGDSLHVTQLSVAQDGLMTAEANGKVRITERPHLTEARIEVSRLQFPAAYASFLQLPLATTDFGALSMAGTASGTIEIADNRVTRVSARIDDLDIEDAEGRLSMTDLQGTLHWADADDAPVEPSRLAWSRASAYGLSGGAAQVDFITRGTGFELLRETRLPIFDGALVINTLAVRQLGAPDAELDFDARIEPISMPLLSRAFGWPELSGQLSGSIPGVTYRNGVLAVEGDLTASVFDGTITGSRFRLRDPFGWPRLYADVTARRLDLELVTRAFPIGSITGRLDADIRGLELFNWSPVAFDARLYSTPDDRSRRLISQKAVTSISSIGGGGGGVAAALQSGFMRFFDTFRYDRIGIACQLRDEVCLMSGLQPAGSGYYIVKGKGLPRIDIIGNAGRVNWPQLVSQIAAGMRSENVIVR